MKKLILFLAVLFGLQFVGVAQIVNPDYINYEIYADEWRQEGDNDSWSNDDNMVRFEVTNDPATGGVRTWHYTGSCTSPYGYVRNWSADAPSSNSYSTAVYSAINRTATGGSLTYTVQSWETDNGFNCLPVNGDDEKWGPTSYTATYRNATKTPNQWWGVNGTNGSGDWSAEAKGRVRLKTAWRYARGETCDNPLSFGTLTSGVTLTHLNSNRLAPTGARAEIGYTNTMGNASPDVYYTFTITQPSVVVINTTSLTTNYDSYLRLYTSDCGTQLAFNDDFGGTTRSQITHNLCAGTYKILVEGFGSNTGVFELSIQATTITANGGTIATTTPSSICPGTILSPFTSTTAASGFGSVVYQWESSTTSSTTGFSNISGATTEAYTPNNIAPTQTTWYRRRAIDECGRIVYSNTIQIIVQTLNTVTSASSSPTVCISTAITNVTHATTGATGIGSAVGLPAGVSAAWSGNTITISGTPTASGIFNYSIPLTGGCGTVNATGTITVNTLSTAPTAITGTTTICNGQSTTLTASGQTLGTGGVIRWYANVCGGTSVGSGASITVSPTANTIYYARVEGTCNTTACVSSTVTVNTLSTAPTAITGTTTICNGQSTTLTANGATLGTGANIRWYTASCGGTAVGTGNSITVSPASTTTYYARAEGTCNTTACVSSTVTVNTLSTAPTAITGTTTICNGSATTLTASGQTLGTGGVIRWYANVCGGTSVGSGASITVSPTANTIYYARVEGTCNTTACVSSTVTVNTLSTAPTAITGTTTICNGQSTTLTASGQTLGTGANIRWYANSCSGTVVGTGNSITVSPSVNTNYFARVEGTCNTTTCVSTLITVTSRSVLPTSVTVDNNSNNCHGRSIVLTANGGSLSGSSTYVWGTTAGGNDLGTTTTNQLTLTPTSSATYYVGVSASGSCAAQSLPTGLTYNLPSAGSNLSVNNESATCYVTGNNPIHFYAPSGNYIGAINPRGRTGIMTMTSYVDATAGTMYACGLPSDERYRTAYMGRHFVVSPTGSISGSQNMDIHFPFTNAEYLALSSASNSTTIGNPNDNVNSLANIAATKYSNSGYEDGTPHNNCGTGIELVIDQIGSGALTGLSVPSIISGTNNYVTFGVATFSEFHLHGVNNHSALPITLSSFTAECKDGVQVNWQTSSEQNVDRFEIYGSRDGQNWSLVANQDAVGNSTNLNSYEAQIPGNLTYFKLLSVDNDGSTQEYGPISADCFSEKDTWKLFPIPVQEHATIVIESTKERMDQLVFVDVQGRIVLEQRIEIKAGQNLLELNLKQLSEGTYWMKMKDSSEDFKPIKFIRIN